MFRDEALDTLLERLDGDPVASLGISVEHGEYAAWYATGVTPTIGERKATATDALVSLVEALDG